MMRGCQCRWPRAMLQERPHLLRLSVPPPRLGKVCSEQRGEGCRRWRSSGFCCNWCDRHRGRPQLQECRASHNSCEKPYGCDRSHLFHRLRSCSLYKPRRIWSALGSSIQAIRYPHTERDLALDDESASRLGRGRTPRSLVDVGSGVRTSCPLSTRVHEQATRCWVSSAGYGTKSMGRLLARHFARGCACMHSPEIPVRWPRVGERYDRCPESGPVPVSC